MSKVVKRFRPKFVKYLRDRPSGIAQTGAHGTSARQNPPDIHRLGWAPRPFPRTGMTGEPNSSIMGRMGSGALSVYTDADREEFEDQSGMPGKGGNYQAGMSRQYKNKGGGKAMMGIPTGGPVGEAYLREVIRSVIIQLNEEPLDRAAFNEENLRAQEDIDDDDDEDDLDEFSGAGGVAGFTLPLGMSNRGPDAPPPWAAYARSIGGTPVQVTGTKTLKVRRMKKPKKA